MAERVVAGALHAGGGRPILKVLLISSVPTGAIFTFAKQVLSWKLKFAKTRASNGLSAGSSAKFRGPGCIQS